SCANAGNATASTAPPAWSACPPRPPSPRPRGRSKRFDKETRRPTMTGTQFGQFILGLIVVAAVVAIVVWLLNWLYLRSSKERAFVRTGLGGQKVVMNG